MTAPHDLEDLDLVASDYAARVAASPAEREVLREEMTTHCLPFAGRLARRYRNRGEPLEDLEQVARIGLVKAIDRYDVDRGSFTAYAVLTISGEIKRHFRDRTWRVHVPRRVQDLGLEVNKAKVALEHELSRAPGQAEIAERLGVDITAVRDALASAAGYTPISLNSPASGSDGTAEFGDLLGEGDPAMESVDDKVTVAGLIARLPERERQILAMRFYGNRTQADIGAELDISQMHVSRLLARALTWLREAMLSDTPPPWEGTGPELRDLTIAVRRSATALTVRVAGEVDRDTATRLRLGLRDAVVKARGIELIIDLSRVPLIDAAGVAVLIDATAAARVAEVPLHLTGVQPQVERVLKIAGVPQ